MIAVSEYAIAKIGSKDPMIVNEELKEQSLGAVNSSLTLRNWFFGYYIFEFEQNGKDRAEYGNALLSNIAIKISVLNIPNTNQY